MSCHFPRNLMSQAPVLQYPNSPIDFNPDVITLEHSCSASTSKENLIEKIECWKSISQYSVLVAILITHVAAASFGMGAMLHTLAAICGADANPIFFYYWIGLGGFGLSACFGLLAEGSHLRSSSLRKMETSPNDQIEMTTLKLKVSRDGSA